MFLAMKCYAAGVQQPGVRSVRREQPERFCRLAIFLVGKAQLKLTRSREVGYCSTGLQPASGSNSVIADAVCVVALPKSFCSNTPSWLMVNVITPELRYSAGYATKANPPTIFPSTT